MLTKQPAFDALIESLLHEGGVEPGAMFGGSPGPRVKGKFFTFLTRQGLVLKLPRDRVDAFVEAGDGDFLNPGTGRIMKGWLVTGESTQDQWQALAREARDYVASLVKRCRGL